MSKKVNITKSEIKQIKKDFDKGYTYKQLSEKYKVSGSYILNHIIEKKRGKGRSGHAIKNMEQVVEMAKQGLTRTEIAKEMNMSKQNVHLIIKNNLEQTQEIKSLNKRINLLKEQLNNLLGV